MARSRNSDLYKVTTTERRLIDQAIDGKGLGIKMVIDMPMGAVLDDIDDSKRIRSKAPSIPTTCKSKTLHICGDTPDPDTAILSYEFPEVFPEVFTEQDQDTENPEVAFVGSMDYVSMTPRRTLRALVAIYSEPLTSDRLSAFCMYGDIEIIVPVTTSPMTLAADDLGRMPMEEMIEPMVFDQTRPIKYKYFKKREEIFPQKVKNKCQIRMGKQLLRRR